MKDYKAKQMRKKARGSQTPGRQKGESCQASSLDRYMAKSSRSYKHKGYGVWLEKVRKQNGA